VVVMVLFAPVTLIVPPPEARKPRPVVVLMAMDVTGLKLIVAPGFVVNSTALIAAVVMA
jgi:hypothetical protein